MDIRLKTDTYPACMGIACDLHAQCARWHAVEGSQCSPDTLGTCLSHDGYPEFVQYNGPALKTSAAATASA